VELVDEQDDLALRVGDPSAPLQPFLEFAAFFWRRRSAIPCRVTICLF
jgi:hypothetical protein